MASTGSEGVPGTVHGRGGDDEIILTQFGGSAFGGGGADTLQGGNGKDLLDGGAGLDAMTGGSGDDTYVVDVAGDAVTELTGGGIDAVRSLVGTRSERKSRT